jgi:hypothetical protein
MFVDLMGLLAKGSDTEISAFALLPVIERLRLLDKDIEEGFVSAGITRFFCFRGAGWVSCHAEKAVCQGSGVRVWAEVYVRLKSSPDYVDV